MRPATAERWLNLSTGLALVVGAYLSAIGAIASFGQPAPVDYARKGLAILCTRTAVEARVPGCEDILPCFCWSYPAERPAPPTVALTTLEQSGSVNRTAMLNNLEAIKLEGRPRRPAFVL